MTRRERSRDAGAAAVEFAIIAPILLIMVFGIIDFGRMFNAQLVINEAAREGVRSAAFSGKANGVNMAKEAAQPYSLKEPVVTDCSDLDTEAAQVALETEFKYATPLPVFVPGLPKSFTISGKATMQCLH